MNYTFLQVIGGIVALAIAIIAWIRSANDKKTKEKVDEDKKIDACTNADDTLIELDRLRNKPPGSP